MSKIIQNAIELPDGTILSSHSTHDYKEKDGYFIDGGKDYIRYGYPEGCKSKFKPLFLQDNSPMDELKKKIIWGTFGKDGKDDLKWVRISLLSLEHLENILINFKKSGKKLEPIRERVIKELILDKRRRFKLNKILEKVKNAK